MAVGLNLRPGAATRPRRRVAFAVLALGVLVAHGCVTQQLAEGIAEIDRQQDMPARVEVAYVREMQLSAPPPTAAPAAPPPAADTRTAMAPKPRKPKKVVKPAKAASAPEAASAPAVAEPVLAAASAPEALPELPAQTAAAASAPEPVAEAASATPAAAVSAAASAPPAAPGAVAFEWPTSTRMSYTLTGNYRGEVNGSAQVEWIRVGARYQVHLDLVVGPSMAPLITRRMSSDGEITAEGLTPQRYDQDTKVVLRDRHRVTIQFEPDTVVLANGDRRASVPGLQDTASQFVQLSYVFSTRPALLRVGGTVDIPLALPHKVDVWTYDVVAEETLYTPFGELPALHLKPRRVSNKVGELSAEIWFAPQLRYLPVRIRIAQGAEHHIDLLISRPPEIASP